MLHHSSSRKPSPLSLSIQELALIGVTCLWGATFLIVHLAMREVGPMTFVGVRFLTAGCASLIMFGRHIRSISRRDLLAGFCIGLSIAGGYGLQTVVLRTISSSQSAFITALYVPIVPLLQWAILRRPPGLMSWLGVSAAFGGMLLLAGPGAGEMSLSFGELVTVVSTLAIASEILLIGHFAPMVDARRSTVAQLLTASLLAFVMAPIAGEGLPHFSWGWVSAAVGLGVASALIQLIMNWAQKSVSPTRATLIYAGEPVWGGIVGKLAGDRLPAASLVGAMLIIVGVLLSGFDRKRSPEEAASAVATDEPARL